MSNEKQWPVATIGGGRPLTTEFPPGVIGVASSFLGRYREFDVSVSNIVVPQGTVVEWRLGVNIAHNFNNTIRSMLSSGAQWVWILGDDHVFLPNTLLNLLRRKVDVVVPLCLRRSSPFLPVLHTSVSGGCARLDWSFLEGKSGLVDISDIAAGNAGMLIQRRVIETMSEPWFETGQINSELGSPDLWFCEKLRNYGIKLHLDLDNPIGHITHAAVWPSKNDQGQYVVDIRVPGDATHLEQEPQKPQQGYSWVECFNMWRETYDTMSFQDQVEFYSQIAQAFPNQRQYNKDEVLFFFGLLQDFESLNVLEIGGWKGELADEILSDPISGVVKKWDNMEICQDAVHNPVCSDERYQVVVQDDFPWNCQDGWEDYDVLVLSHVLEHMKADNFRALVKLLPNVKQIYIDAPIEEDTGGVDWQGYLGTHILEIGWKDVVRLLEQYNFVEKYVSEDGNIRFFNHQPMFKF